MKTTCTGPKSAGVRRIHKCLRYFTFIHGESRFFPRFHGRSRDFTFVNSRRGGVPKMRPGFRGKAVYWNIKGWGHFVVSFWLNSLCFLCCAWYHFEQVVVPQP